MDNKVKKKNEMIKVRVEIDDTENKTKQKNSMKQKFSRKLINLINLYSDLHEREKTQIARHRNKWCYLQ